MGSGTGSDQNIDLGQHGREPRVLDRRALKQGGQFHGALVGAVGDEDMRLSGTGTPQVTGRQLRHFTGARDHDRAVFERAENLAR